MAYYLLYTCILVNKIKRSPYDIDLLFDIVYFYHQIIYFIAITNQHFRAYIKYTTILQLTINHLFISIGSDGDNEINQIDVHFNI